MIELTRCIIGGPLKNTIFFFFLHPALNSKQFQKILQIIIIIINNEFIVIYYRTISFNMVFHSWFWHVNAHDSMCLLNASERSRRPETLPFPFGYNLW